MADIDLQSGIPGLLVIVVVGVGAAGRCGEASGYQGNQVERLPGFSNREQTLALYEEIDGSAVEDIEWFEVLAGMRFSVILTRLAQQLMDQDFLPKDTDFEWNNPVSNLHARQLEELGIA